jgi:hypothetical protein
VRSARDGASFAPCMAFNAGMDGDTGREKGSSVSGVLLSGGGAAATLTGVYCGGLVGGDRSDATCDGGCPGDTFLSIQCGDWCHPRK